MAVAAVAVLNLAGVRADAAETACEFGGMPHITLSCLGVAIDGTKGSQVQLVGTLAWH